MNGMKEQHRSVTPSSYLGKRKRSASPEEPTINGSANAHRSDSNIDNIVREVKKYAIATSILEHPLPKPTSAAPSVKKQRNDVAANTVEGRLALDLYPHTDDLLADLSQVVVEKKKELPQTNGHHQNSEASDLQSIQDLLEQYGRTNSAKNASHPTSLAGEVMTVRSVVEGGAPKQLFTGLRIHPGQGIKTEEIDVRKLPSGFDIVEAMPADISRKSTTKDFRTFGHVFKQLRNSRQLEPPRSSRGTQSTDLRFEKPFKTAANINKDDYRLAALTAGSWLEYATSPVEHGKQPLQRPKSSKQDPQALFKAAFSSFAPSEDNANAVVPRSDRSRQWFKKHGTQAMQKIMLSGDEPGSAATSIYPEINDDYQQLIDDFEPETIADANVQQSDPPDSEKEVLDDISELLQTLSSYQQIRDLERNRIYNTTSKPTGPEADTFEILRQQLSILVASLPPSAVARLDGDHLRALNIRTSILVQTPEVAGVGQPDEGTLQRQREAQAQQAAMARPVNPPPVRNSYTSNTPAPSYNNQARTYSGNATQTPSMPGYAQRNAQMYNTPRPNVPATATSYTPGYQRPSQPYPGATIQQYQRMQNGYGQGVQTPYQQRPAQPPYQAQNQMQNATQFARNASPAKPMVNGQMYASQTTSQPQRNQYSTPTPSTALLQGSYAQANSHATIQQIKAAQQAGQMPTQPSQSQSPQPQTMQGIQHTNTVALQAHQQRQPSGTPQPRSSTQTPQQQHANIAAASTNSVAGSALGAVPGQIGPTVQASQQQQMQRGTPTPTPVAAGAGGA
ncbi:hypothetical protein PMZ80_005154 [Knufia obscura]|uniref:Uncharacterized protein n=1 Tax=Knufia obscura TaxID=1635080 RepID=A0ABR0RQT2_9EURO|nr:hypothetical protein PMZ80_005154 [Knufia obscura]